MKKTTHGEYNKNGFSFRGRTKILYLLTLVALLAAGVIGHLLVPTGGTISAQAGDPVVRNLITVEQIGSNESAISETSGDALKNDGAYDTSERALFKVCKIAGPGINVGRLFSFTVTGQGATNAAGTVGTVARTFDVAAGLAADGGICSFVPGFGAGAGNAEFQTFAVGGIVTVTENPETLNNGTLRVSRVRATTPASRPSEFVVNVLVASADTVEVEYTNFLFRPTILKICKIAGPGIALNTPFTFTTTFVSPTGAGGTLFPPFTTTTTVPAGVAAQGGNCNIVSAAGLIGGAFNISSTVTVTENAAPGTIVSNIASSTSVIPTFVPPARSTTLSGEQGLVQGITQVTFTNVSNPPPCSFSISPTGIYLPVLGSTGSFVVNTNPKCIWTAVSNAPWIIITSNPNGLGSGTVNFSVAANAGGQRIGTISVGGQNFFVEQAGNCFLTLSSNEASFSAAGGSGQFEASNSICSPMPSVIGVSNAPWITITSTSYPGGLSVNYNVQPNNGAPRTGTITVSGFTTRIFTITQAGGLANLRTRFDYDGDGAADVSVFRPSNGTWYLNRSTTGFYAAQWGASPDTLVPGDYDGDGRTDLAVFRKSANSTWYILNTLDNTFRAVQWGATNLEQQLLLFDQVAPGDYDGDGKTDLAVWRLTDHLSEPARFVILQSSNNVGIARQWGGFGDSLVQAADYDGDGRTDLTVRRGATWYILLSQTNEPRAVQFGLSSDKTVPADYDGDGKADIAVVRNGTWYLQRSRDGFLGLQFGLPSDLPVPADYDGDGKTDVAVFREGTWYLQRSQLGFTGVAFGAATDKPIPNAFIP